MTWRLETWQGTFVVAVMGAALILLGYAEIRRILHAAIDDRYGEFARFWKRLGGSSGAGGRLSYAVQYCIAFFFSFGVHDLVRLAMLVGFDLFIVFALLSPFWRYVFFDEWNPALAVAMALAGISVFIAWKVRYSLNLCRLHEWSPDTWVCQRCGEFHADVEEQEQPAKSRLAAPKPPGLLGRLSWHRFWEKRLERLAERLESEPK